MTELLPLNTSPLPVKLRVGDYLLLDGSDALAAYRKTELIAGEIVFMNAQHRPHARIKSRLYRLIADALDAQGSDLEAVVEASVAIPPHDVPGPDIVITREPDGAGLVPLQSVALVVEVSDTTLDNDLAVKRKIYAAALIPEYWVADVNARVIHQMWQTDGDAYAEHREIAFGTRLEAATLPGLTVATGGL